MSQPNFSIQGENIFYIQGGGAKYGCDGNIDINLEEDKDKNLTFSDKDFNIRKTIFAIVQNVSHLRNYKYL